MHPTVQAHLRIARPTPSIPALLPFYTKGLGFSVLLEFVDHEGFDGVMLGHPGAAYHLEFITHKAEAAALDASFGRAPTQDNLLVFYLPEKSEYEAAVRQMEGAGFVAMASMNPYWDRCGKTFEDADGWRVVFANMKNPCEKKGTSS